MSERCAVLVVDDEDANLETFQRVFRREFDIALARSGAEALALLQARSFDIAFVDYAMPDMNGIDLLRKVAQLHPHMTRVMVTAHDGLAEVRESRVEGIVVTILGKPWQRERVAQLVTTAQHMARMRASVERLGDGRRR